MKHYTLVKKWRLDEFEHAHTRTKIGIYVTQGGEFYARVPEYEEGTLVTAKTKVGLTLLIQQTADRVLCLEWRKVIAVSLASPQEGEFYTRRSHGYRTLRWDPEKPLSAGSNIDLSFIRYEVSVQPDGKRCERDWYDGGNSGHRHVDIREFFPVTGENVELPYTEELWEALSDFKKRLAELSHSIRTLISRSDVVPMLIAASRQKLLTVRDPE